MIDKLLRKLLMLHGNEAISLSKTYYFDLLMLIAELARIKYGIRYHDYTRECKCQPEVKIKWLLNNKKLKIFLEKEDLLDSLNEILETKINKNETVWSD